MLQLVAMLAGARSLHGGVRLMVGASVLSIIEDRGGAQVRRVDGQIELVEIGAVLLPGEPERQARAARRAGGIPIDPTTWDHIMAAGEGLGLARADLEAMA